MGIIRKVLKVFSITILAILLFMLSINLLVHLTYTPTKQNISEETIEPGYYPKFYVQNIRAKATRDGNKIILDFTIGVDKPETELIIKGYRGDLFIDMISVSESEQEVEGKMKIIGEVTLRLTHREEIPFTKTNIKIPATTSTFHLVIPVTIGCEIKPKIKISGWFSFRYEGTSLSGTESCEFENFSILIY